MDMLNDIYRSNPDYFTGTGGVFEGSQFQYDLRLHSRKSQKSIGGTLMQDELGMSVYEVLEAEQRNPRIAVEYLRRSQYAKRTSKLWSDLKSRQK